MDSEVNGLLNWMGDSKYFGGEIKEEEKLEAVEVKEEETKEDITKPVEEMSLLKEMRGLLMNYNFELGFSPEKNPVKIVENLILINDILAYCENKSLKDEFKKLVQQERQLFYSKTNYKKMLNLYFEYINYAGSFNKRIVLRKFNHSMLENLDNIVNFTQKYLMAFPLKGKRDMHLKTSQGLPAVAAEAYESSEIEAGEKVDPSKPFKFDDEGKVYQV